MGRVMTEESMSAELVDHVLQNIDEKGLSEWELEFVKNVRAYWKRHHKLSEKQTKRLREIWEGRDDAKRRYRDKL
jgi:hypothetical protein